MLLSDISLNNKILFISIITLILSNALTLRQDKSLLYSRSTNLILISTVIILYYIIDMSYFQESISIFSGLFFCKNNTFVFTFFVFSLTIIILLLTSFYPRKIVSYTSITNIINNFSDKSISFIKDENTNIQYINKTSEQYKIIEYPLIILFIISGGIFLMSSSDLISIFLAIELQSYGLYLLCSIYRNSELATNAGLTYFLLGGLSSCIILLGQGLLYIYSGNTYLDGIYIIHSIFESTQFNQTDITSNVNNILIEQYTLQLAMIVFTTGFLFKISAAPFHFWSPDVYDAIPTIVTTFVAIIAKITILIFFIELIYYTSTISYTYTWKNNLLLSSFLSLIIGSVLGLHQVRIKRLLAYSTISHIGFLLLALSINSIESIQAFYFYLIQYSITNLNAFFLLIAIGYSFLFLIDNSHKEKHLAISSLENKVTHSAVENKGKLLDSLSPIQLISQIKGYFYINSVLTVSLAITLFSFVGVPPLVGFFAKQMVLSAALDNGYIFMTLVGILTSVISAVYYLAIVKELFFEQSEYKQIEKINSNNNIFLSSSLTCTISILTLFILLFVFIPTELLYLTSILTI